MTLKRKTLIAISALFFSFSLVVGQTTLQVDIKNGSSSTRTLLEMKKIRFNGAYMIVDQKSNDSTLYTLGAIKQIKFFDPHATSLPQTTSNKAAHLEITPLPVMSEMQVRLNCDLSESISINIYDSRGLLIIQKQFTSTAGINSFTLDLSNLASGVYILKLDRNNSSECAKIIKN